MSLKKNFIPFVISIVSFLLIIILIVFFNLPENPIETDSKFKNNFNLFFPEGWSFFTRNPREEICFFYTEGLQEIDLKNTSSVSLYGLSRYNRIRGIETSLILSKIPDSIWIDCDKDIRSVLDTRGFLKIKNSTRIKSICGQLIIQKKKLIPWAWWKINDQVLMNSKIAKVYVDCD